jgi:hypothetical protein
VRLREIPVGVSDLLALDKDVQARRSPGLHLSDIIRSLLHQIDPKTYPERYRPDLASLDASTLIRFEAGFLFERLFGVAMAERLASRFTNGEVAVQREVTRDDIIMTPDIYDGLAVTDTKLTWKSSRGAPSDRKFAAWWWQLKSYCHAYGTHIGRLEVLFVNGDYRGSGPQWLAWEAQFSEDELQANWRMVLAEARRIRSHYQGGKA